MITKAKIRKVESSIDEIFSRIEKLIEVREKLNFIETPINIIYESLGLKNLEFWEIRFDNEELFDKMFVIQTRRQQGVVMKVIMKRSIYEKQNLEMKNK